MGTIVFRSERDASRTNAKATDIDVLRRSASVHNQRINDGALPALIGPFLRHWPSRLVIGSDAFILIVREPGYRAEFSGDEQTPFSFSEIRPLLLG